MLQFPPVIQLFGLHKFGGHQRYRRLSCGDVAPLMGPVYRRSFSFAVHHRYGRLLVFWCLFYGIKPKKTMQNEQKNHDIALAALNALDYSASEISDLMDEFAFADRLTMEQKHRLIELHEYMTHKYRACLNVLVNPKI